MSGKARHMLGSALSLLLAGLAAVITGACTSSNSLLTSTLDPVTSVTISYSRSPMVFYRDVAGRAAYARDFVHVAPLEVNRSGRYRYFLWLGIWNTMEAAPSSQSRDGFESIVIFADGEPLPLDIAGWTASAIGASEPVHLKPVASAADAYYEVTVDQLRLIAEAKDIRIQSTGARSESYETWDDQAIARDGLIEFLQSSVY